ncbi:MAG: response regulator transcription factor [Nitrospinota bacterium]|nr:response regulator transcription factor [Nitrospinota bacterium]
MAKLLIYTADESLGDALERALRREGHFCSTVVEEESALSGIKTHGLSLVLLDDAPALPKVSEIRKWTTLPILLLSETGRLSNIGTPFEPDDIITKPIREEELILRVKNLCIQKDHELNNPIENGYNNEGLTVDEDRYEIRLDGEIVDLTFREFELLKHLIQNPERVFDREQLLNLVWGFDYFGGPRTVDVHVRRIRSKIEAKGKNYIKTIRNVGYKFIKDEEG